MLPGMGSESLPVSRLEKLQIEVVGFEIRLPLVVLFTLNLSPAPSLPHKGTVGAKRRRGGCGQERRRQRCGSKGHCCQFHGNREAKEGVGVENKVRGSKTVWINDHLLRYLLEEIINEALPMSFLPLCGGRCTMIPIMEMNEKRYSKLKALIHSHRCIRLGN